MQAHILTLLAKPPRYVACNVLPIRYLGVPMECLLSNTETLYYSVLQAQLHINTLILWGNKVEIISPVWRHFVVN